MENLRLELNHKNEIIDKLLQNLTAKEQSCNTLIETMLRENKCNHNICDMCKIKEMSLNDNINQNIIGNHHSENSNPLRSNPFIVSAQYDNRSPANNLHIPSQNNTEFDNQHDSQGEQIHDKVYSWISSNENSGMYETISDVSNINNDDFNYDHKNSNNVTISQHNVYLQSINIESAINRHNDITPHSRASRENKSNNHLWPENTCLIVGSSILNNLDENKLNKRGSNLIVKVRAFSGSTIRDMYSYITPLLQKEPKHIILHVGGNDAPYKSADDILVELLQIKSFILNKLPNCNLYLSQPTTRYDNVKAKYTIRDLNIKLNLLNINIVDNSNIEEEQLGKKGLHLNKWGTSKLAMNYISLMRQF